MNDIDKKTATSRLSNEGNRVRETHRNKRPSNIEKQRPDLVRDREFKKENHQITKLNTRYSRYLGGGGRMKITNTKGVVLYQASDENPALRVTSIEGGNKIGISRGDGRFRIIDTESEEFIDLPSKPPLSNAVGFGSWEWITPDLLIGTSGIEADKDPDPTLRCCDQHTVSRSLLYFYDIPQQELKLVHLPSELNGKVFSISHVTTDGFIELLSSSGHEDDGQPLGWFKIDQ